MKIVLAPNAFKGCLTASQVGKALAAGIRSALPSAQISIVPMADGGDGLVDIAKETLNGQTIDCIVKDPFFEDRPAQYCFVDSMKFAAIEMALASGLALLPEERLNPENTSSYGTGQLILSALDQGATRIGVGLGGSATNDGGIGMAAALGVRFFNAGNKIVHPIGRNLDEIVRIEMSGLDPRLAGIEIEAVCDVTNPLVGPEGASAMFGPQKGASPEQVASLDAGLEHLANLVEAQLGIKISNLPGSGAAGGMGAGLVAFAGAKLRSGVDMMMELVGLETALNGADLCITGEGRIDRQTQFGKAPAGVAAMAKRLGIPCIGVAGSIGTDLEPLHDLGMTALFALADGPVSLEESLQRTEELLFRLGAQIARVTDQLAK